MAKKKAVVKETAVPTCEYVPSVYLDMVALSALKNVTVGEEVTVIMKGKVKSMEQREDYDNPKKIHGSLSLKEYEIEIMAGTDVWDELSEEEDD